MTQSTITLCFSLVCWFTFISISFQCPCTCTGPHSQWQHCTFDLPHCSEPCSGAQEQPASHSNTRSIVLFSGTNDDIGLIYRNEALSHCSRSCRFIVNDRSPSTLHNAHAVVFPLIYFEPNHLPMRSSLPLSQIWIAHCAESPLNYFGRHLRSPAMMKRFDLHATVLDSAEIRFNYLSFDLFRHRTWAKLVGPPPDLASKDRGVVVWLATNCNAPNRRQEYVSELMKHIHVDNHGDCLRNVAADSSVNRYAADWQKRKIDLISRYHFVLAFENTAVDNYVTEKFYDAFLAGTVPVYMGARNVHQFAPSNDSFISVDEFATPKALADHLIAVAADPERYMALHAWRTRLIEPRFALLARESMNTVACRVCEAVHESRVHKETTTGHTTSERLKLTLELKVDKVDFDPQASTLRLKGTNCTESPWIKLGASHTIAIELNRDLTLIKSEWDQVSFKRIKDAADPSTTADAAAVVMDEGIATLCLLKPNMTITVATIDVSVPRKRRGSTAQHDKAVVKFFEMVLTAIEQKFRFDILKVILIASPGFVRESFLKWMWDTAIRLDKKLLIDHRAKFVAVHSTSGYKHALTEVLASTEALKLLSDTKFAAEVKLLARFSELLRTDPDRAYYGFKHVSWANGHKAVETLLITDELFRAASVEKRREYIALIDSVKRNGGIIHIFSALHVSGEQLQQLTGVAAVLRYALPEPDNLADDSSESSTESDQSGNSDGSSFSAFRARQDNSIRSVSSRSDKTQPLSHKSTDDDSISITDSGDEDANDHFEIVADDNLSPSPRNGDDNDDDDDDTASQ